MDGTLTGILDSAMAQEPMATACLMRCCCSPCSLTQWAVSRRIVCQLQADPLQDMLKLCGPEEEGCTQPLFSSFKLCNPTSLSISPALHNLCLRHRAGMAAALGTCKRMAWADMGGTATMLGMAWTDMAAAGSSSTMIPLMTMLMTKM